jgi:hypothetical protein
MKTQTQIKITGQTQGNNEILRVLNPDGIVERLPFGDILVNYDLITIAKASLRLAFETLEEEGAVLVNSSKLRYDSSSAEII